MNLTARLTINKSVDQETWDALFSVNVRGMMFCYKWAAKQMIKQGKGGKLIGKWPILLKISLSIPNAILPFRWLFRGRPHR